MPNLKIKESLVRTTINCFAVSVLIGPWGVSQAISLSEDISLDASIGIYSQYHTRGFSQTQGDPAIQGALTISHASGAYAGIWSSNVDFGVGSTTRQEIDYYIGYLWQVADDVSLELTYFKYEYPRQAFLNYSETFAKLKAYGAYVGAYYSGDLGGGQAYLYSILGYEVTLPADVGLDLRYGYVDYKDDTFVGGKGNMRDGYGEWQVTLSKKMAGLDWSVAYVDSDLSDTECYNFTGYSDLCSQAVVVGVSKSF